MCVYYDSGNMLIDKFNKKELDEIDTQWECDVVY